MATSKESQAWLDELKKTGEVDDATFKTLSDAVGSNEKLDTFIKTKHGEGLRQEDYNKNMNDLKTQREASDKEHAARMATVNTYEGTLQTWKTDQEAKIKAESQSRTEAEQLLASLQSVVQSKVTEFGLDPKDFQVEPTVKPDPKPADLAPAPDLEAFKKDYLPRSEFDTVLSGNLKVPAILHDISTEHQKLMGETINAEDLLNGAIEAKKPLKEFWEDTHNIVQKREEVAQASQKAHDDKIREDAEANVRTQLLSEGYSPKPQSGSQAGSPVLGSEMPIPPEPKPNEILSDVQRKQNRVGAAVADYAQAGLENQGAGQ